MKFVALVSGGKDSCFNILHCLAQGHELVCLANLYPPQEDNDEIDSYMYQTVGHDILTLYEKCIGKPMYRQPILGKAANQNLEYNKTADDETEDLFKLLSTVLEKHPDVKGVSVGAILSSYQRTRVEDVCLRLGLTSLAYLWQRDQGELMNEMCQSDMDARIIKVAAIGLDESNLGMSLRQIHPKLKELNAMFGVHICGEGGEFETSVVDAPFFKFGRIKIVDQTVVKHTNDDVWYLRMKVAFEPKEQVDDGAADFLGSVVEPPLLDDRFQELYDVVEGEVSPGESVESGQSTEVAAAEAVSCSWESNVFETSDKLFISNLSSNSDTVEEQVVGIFEQLGQMLAEKGLGFENIQSSRLLVRDMGGFVPINQIYVSYFQKPLPPSRICVETNLPSGMHAQLSVVVLKNIECKSGLHVQGMSYWAPCNIGPYSQAVASRDDRIVRISGQIPLVPKTMLLSTGGDLLAAVLSLQHYNSIKEVTGCEKNLLTVCFIRTGSLAPMASRVFKEYLDVCGERGSGGADNLVVVQVTGLPKGSSIEWGGLSYKEESCYLDYGSDSEADDDSPADITRTLAVHYRDQLDGFEFRDDRFYEIYASPRKVHVESVASIRAYELIPVVQAFDGACRGDKVAIVEMVL